MEPKASRFDLVIWIKNFLIWASGAQPELLIRYAPEECDFHFAIGGQVILTSVLSGLGMSATLTDAGAPWFAIILGACLWAVCIFWLDRLLLMPDPGAGKLKTGVKLAGRLIFAICISYVVSESILQLLFRPEVKAQLQFETLEARRINHDVALQADPELVALRDSKRDKEQESVAKSREVSALREAYIAEAEGRAGTRRKGLGDVFKEKKSNYETAMKEEADLRAEIAELDNRLQERERQFRQIVESAMTGAGASGFLANHRALMKVLARESSGLILYIALVLALVTLETSALVSKIGRFSTLDERAQTITRLTRVKGALERRMVGDAAEAIATIGLEKGPQHLRNVMQIMTGLAEHEIRLQMDSSRLGGVAAEFVRVHLAHPACDIVADCVADTTLDELLSSIRALPECEALEHSIMSAGIGAYNEQGVAIVHDAPLAPQISPDYRVIFRMPQYAGGGAA